MRPRALTTPAVTLPASPRGLPTATTQSPSHTYAAAGTYDVSLTATNAGGPGSLTKTAYIVVSAAPPPPPPVAAFAADVHEVDLGLVVEEVVVQRRHFEVVREGS